MGLIELTGFGDFLRAVGFDADQLGGTDLKSDALGGEEVCAMKTPLSSTHAHNTIADCMNMRMAA